MVGQQGAASRPLGPASLPGSPLMFHPAGSIPRGCGAKAGRGGSGRYLSGSPQYARPHPPSDSRHSLSPGKEGRQQELGTCPGQLFQSLPDDFLIIPLDSAHHRGWDGGSELRQVFCRGGAEDGRFVGRVQSRRLGLKLCLQSQWALLTQSLSLVGLGRGDARGCCVRPLMPPASPRGGQHRNSGMHQLWRVSGPLPL